MWNSWRTYCNWNNEGKGIRSKIIIRCFDNKDHNKNESWNISENNNACEKFLPHRRKKDANKNLKQLIVNYCNHNHNTKNNMNSVDDNDDVSSLYIAFMRMLIITISFHLVFFRNTIMITIRWYRPLQNGDVVPAISCVHNCCNHRIPCSV